MEIKWGEGMQLRGEHLTSAPPQGVPCLSATSGMRRVCALPQLLLSVGEGALESPGTTRSSLGPAAPPAGTPPGGGWAGRELCGLLRDHHWQSLKELWPKGGRC